MDPYQPPKSTLDHDPIEPQPEAVFRHLEVASMVIYSVLTLGIYVLYWLWVQTRVVDANSDTPINPVVLKAASILHVIFVLSYVSNQWIGYTSFLAIFFPLTNFAAGVLYEGWVFLIRDEVNRLSGAKRGDLAWASPFWTALFMPFYLQHKINQILRERNTSG